MTIKKIDSTALNDWVDKLISQKKVYGVVEKDRHFVFDQLERSSELRLDYDITILSPKKYILPQTEVFMKFDRRGSYEGVFEKEPFILFGVHPYDMVAISQMDTFFLSENTDPHYKTRRDNATIVVCDPERPSKNTFASSMGTAVVKEGFDVLLTKIGSDYVLEAPTEKGKALLKHLSRSNTAQKSDLDAREKVWEKNIKTFNKHELKMKLEDLPKLLQKSYDHPVWKKMSEKCFSCGSCNLVCPTCYCFDVQEDVKWDLQCGERCRSWDGCLLTDFAIVAGNHNFRKDRADRFRHRFYRKGKYLWDKYGHISCVGCGRCVSACVTNIANPVEVYNALLEG